MRWLYLHMENKWAPAELRMPVSKEPQTAGAYTVTVDWMVNQNQVRPWGIKLPWLIRLNPTSDQRVISFSFPAWFFLTWCEEWYGMVIYSRGSSGAWNGYQEPFWKFTEISAKNKRFWATNFQQKTFFPQSRPPSKKKTWFNPSGALTIFGLFSSGLQKERPCIENDNYDRHVYDTVTKIMLDKYNCTVVFNPAIFYPDGRNISICQDSQAVEALKYYEATPVVAESLYLHRDIL